jgi:hypothetical protein
MINNGCRAGINHIPGQLYTPAEIDLFLVGEKIFIKAPATVKNLRTDE